MNRVILFRNIFILGSLATLVIGCKALQPTKVPLMDERFKEVLATSSASHTPLQPHPPLPIDVSTRPARDQKAREMFKSYEATNLIAPQKSDDAP